MAAPVPGALRKGDLKSSTALTPPGSQPDDEGADDQNNADEQQEGEQASPEEEAQMKQFLQMAETMMYGKGGKNPYTDALLERLRSGDPVQSLADAAFGVVHAIALKAQQGGEKLFPSVLLYGGYAVVQDIAQFSTQVSKAQGTPSYTDQMQQQAYLKGVDQWRSMLQKQGLINQDLARQDWGNFMQADQQGNPDSVVPGASGAAKMFVSESNKGAATDQGDGTTLAPGGDNEAGEPPDDEAAEDEGPPAPVKAPMPPKKKAKQKGKR